jgi:hypothetical protein
MVDERSSRATFTPFSDASSEWGMAGLYGLEAWQHRWTELEKKMVDRYKDEGARIAVGEMAAVLVTALMFKEQWEGKIVEFRCDNTNVCTAINTGRCKNKRIREMVKALSLLAVSHKFHVYARYIPSCFNSMADFLSRQVLSGDLPRHHLRLKSHTEVEAALSALPSWKR